MMLPRLKNLLKLDDDLISKVVEKVEHEFDEQSGVRSTDLKTFEIAVAVAFKE